MIKLYLVLLVTFLGTGLNAQICLDTISGVMLGYESGPYIFMPLSQPSMTEFPSCDKKEYYGFFLEKIHQGSREPRAVMQKFGQISPQIYNMMTVNIDLVYQVELKALPRKELLLIFPTDDCNISILKTPVSVTVHDILLKN